MKINVFLPKIAWSYPKAKFNLRRSQKTEHRLNLRTACTVKPRLFGLELPWTFPDVGIFRKWGKPP